MFIFFFGGGVTSKMFNLHDEGSERKKTEDNGEKGAGTCSTVLSDLLTTSEHAQCSPGAPHVLRNISGLLLSTDTHAGTQSPCEGEKDIGPLLGS